VPLVAADPTKQPLPRWILWLILVPLGILAVLALLGLIDGLQDTDCQVGFYTACGPGMKTLAYLAFIGLPGLAVYFPIVGLVWTVRKIKETSRWQP